jgi:hypothetical protein
MKKVLISLLFALISLPIFTGRIFAAEPIQCQNRYLTLVNPVRDRSLWADKSLNPIKQQYSEINKYSFAASWLLQYDTLNDQDLINETKAFDSKQEKGVFLEISKNLATDAGVTYPTGVRWSDPGAVFLSAYSQTERKILIDQIFEGFKKVFGTYPKSVGAWWIDSYSLDYMVGKYKIKTALIVADQKVTDSYGVWGQWWGFPYKPSKANILVPASNAGNSENAVIVQWAQRDPILAYGGVGEFSRYSLQANDYVVVGKNINYFKGLVSQYLDCKNPLGQITVGLETGMESLREPLEYERQLQYLSTIPNLNIVTMANFAEKYSQVYKINPDKVLFGDSGAEWEMTPGYRKNVKLGEDINYNQNISFKDYFIRDNSNFLNRLLPVKGLENPVSYFPWIWITISVLGFISILKKKKAVFASAALFGLASFGLIFKSGVVFGWQVFYGPVFKNITLLQILLLLVVFILVWMTYIKLKPHLQNINLFLQLLPLSFGLDTILRFLRVSNLDGKYFIGILYERVKIAGIVFDRRSLEIVSKALPIESASSFLKIPFDKIWQSLPLYTIFYPLAHVFLACLLFLLLRKMKPGIRNVILFILIIFFIWQIAWIFSFDPRIVLPTTN